MGVLKVWDGSAWQTVAAGWSDTGWLLLTNEDAANWDFTGVGFEYRKLNGVVYLQAEIQRLGAAIATNSALSATLTTLPVGFRPSRNLYIPMTSGDPGVILQLLIRPDGTMSVRNKSATDTFDTNQFMQVVISFLPA